IEVKWICKRVAHVLESEAGILAHGVGVRWSKHMASMRLQRLWSRGRWEQTVQLGELILRKWLIECADVFFQPLAVAGFGNDDYVLGGEQPGQRDLRWRT